MIRFNTTTVYKEKHFYLPLLLGHLLDDINDDVVINSSDIQHHWLQYSNEPNSKATLLLKRWLYFVFLQNGLFYSLIVSKSKIKKKQICFYAIDTFGAIRFKIFNIYNTSYILIFIKYTVEFANIIPIWFESKYFYVKSGSHYCI